MSFIYWIFLSLVAPSSPTTQAIAEPDLLTETQTKYSKAKYIKMDVEKVFTLTALNKEKRSGGKLFLAPKGRFRLEIEEPEKSLIVIDGKNIWIVQYPIVKEDKIQIMHSKLKTQLRSQVILSFLMGQGKVKNQFKILNKKTQDDEVTFILEPKEEGSDLKDINLVIDAKEKIIDKISYKDNLENKVSFVFKNKKFDEKFDESKFKFKIPKNSEVSEMN